MDNNTMEDLRESYFRIKKLSILIKEFLEEGDPDLILNESVEERKERKTERQDLIKYLKITTRMSLAEFTNFENEVNLPPYVEQIVNKVKSILYDLMESLSNYDKALKDLY